MRSKPQTLQAIEGLYKLYARFNKKYFADLLPKEVRLVIVPMNRTGYSIDTRPKKRGDLEVGCTTIPDDPAAPRTVEINDLTLMDEPYARIVLMHEMIHVKGVLNHGPEFTREIDRIAKLGFLREIV